MTVSNIFHFMHMMYCFLANFPYLRWLLYLITMTKFPATKWIWLNPTTWPCQLKSPDTSLLTTSFHGFLSSGTVIFISYPMFSALNNYIFSQIIIKIKNDLEGWNFIPFRLSCITYNEFPFSLYLIQTLPCHAYL